MIEFVSIEEYRAMRKGHPGYIYVLIDNAIIGKESLIKTISHGIGSPYSGDNWDGLDDTLRDLSWIRDNTVCIMHSSLPVLSLKDTSIYFSILNNTDTSWSNNPGQNSVCVKIMFDQSLKSALCFLDRAGDK